ncbi:hypothetical protein XFF6166_10100 [Xanthomonas citri pv. fuscans]|nr:hypothetical protein XFF6166_10100 [Xanthomonas citri pv. fuscans]SOO02289.1 hypothetical protein XFF6960_590104 [Xanthomonas citri pv. fuscans]SOO06693.1 hypothetical protein XFF7767_80102 [Xanthomonas citri pv. fuscans]SOO11185.1 hypothetical protein XFF6970_70115 [Xanthomonas citri pv. fuscans]SOO45867.1 hypothetical protein XFF1815_900207 [Xanthomonas citri pv. fuscans]
MRTYASADSCLVGIAAGLRRLDVECWVPAPPKRVHLARRGREGLPTTEHAAASRLGRSLRVAARTEIKPCLEFSRRNRFSQR